jgi:predicted nucleic acid-binding protein
MPVLVDSSLWVHQLCKSGDPAKRDRVNALLESGEAAWCPPVRLELWRGVTNDAERKTLRRYEALLPDCEISPEVWNRSIQLAASRSDELPQVRRSGAAHIPMPM